MKSNLRNRFVEFLIKHQLLNRGDKVLIAVSGGVDSMVLLHLMDNSKDRFKLSLGVVHLNHMIRGQPALDDAKFVESFCIKKRIPFHGVKKNVVQFASDVRLSLEEAGHLIREDLFEKIAFEFNYNKIATAHHLDDQAETVLMRLISGCGLPGLAAVRLKRKQWIRPLLFVKKNEIEEYARKHDLDFRTDLTNTDTTIPRNKIRQKLMPLLKQEFNPKISTHFTNLAAILAEWDIYIENEVNKTVKKLNLNIYENKITLELTGFSLYFSWIKYGVVEYILKEIKKKPRKIQYNQFSDFCYWAEKGRAGSKFLWETDIICTKTKKTLIFYKENKNNLNQTVFKIFPNERFSIPESKTVVVLTRVEKNCVTFSKKHLTEYLDGDKFQFPLSIRNWQKEDRFQPLGMQNHKLVSDFLINRKITYPEKDFVKVLLNNNEIVAVLGLQVSEKYKISSSSKKIYKLTVYSPDYE